MNPNSFTIQVTYPLREGRLVLRTDDDWDLDHEPVAVSSDQQRFDFTITSARPYFYFKPGLYTDGVFQFARGGDYLATASSQDARNVYPYFLADDEKNICERLQIHSDVFAEPHHIRVFYPPGYTENTLKHYPVLYMQDGQNLFFPDEAFTGEHWQVGETLTMLDSMNIIRKTIVVGVYPADREFEYTKPGYEAYGRFLTGELKPMIDRGFRTLTDAANTAVMGSSLGGVVSFFLGWEHPDVFGKVACLSSTFTFRDDLLERVIEEEKRDIKIYLDSGWPGDNYEVTRSMRDVLIQRGYEAGKDLLYFAFPKDIHNERYWAMRSHIPFQFFFSEVPTTR